MDLCFIDSFHIMVQALKMGKVYYSFSKFEEVPIELLSMAQSITSSEC
ncbi:hypothetical protein LOK49_Contig214G00035 [Camellia lanceoleosa]|nr:hypothetical protein LOK49_Contig214G00035 [Camellia lanceoleosa]